MNSRQLFNISLLLCIICIFVGCGVNNLNDSEQSSSVEQMNASHEIQNGILNEQECKLRLVINTLSMYHEETGQEYETELSQIDKYGISNYSQYDDWYPFNSMDDMVTVFGSSDFQKYIFEEYGTHLNSEYYLPQAAVVDMYEAETLNINLLFVNSEYYFSIIGSSFGPGASDLIIWGVYDAQQEVDAKALAEFYAVLDGLEVRSEKRDNGSTIYCLFSVNGSVLFEDIGYQTNKPATAYLWEQDDVIGVLILPGEHKVENLDLCVLEKHEI